MGRIFLIKLDGEHYSCKYCSAHLALEDDLHSRDFICRHGQGYLFEKVVNVTVGEKEDRTMMTGLYAVADIFCVGCGSLLGWKYETAYLAQQKHKEGKFILERSMILSPEGSIDQLLLPRAADVETSEED